MAGHCTKTVQRDGQPDECGRVLNVDGSCENAKNHVGSHKL